LWTSEVSRPYMTPRRIRQTILQQSKRANVGHIGSCLCVVEILCALYSRVLRINSPTDQDRDRFILSKGHAGLALYAVLALKGWLNDTALSSFCCDGSLLGVHPESAVPGVDFSTGSLGHGLSMATGAALAARMRQSERQVFCLISDAECNEGSVWEAAMFASHHQLGNLTAIVDLNGQQAMGLTRDVLDIPNLKERWEAFGWRVTEVDGHSLEELSRSFENGRRTEGDPHMVLARTTFGKGVSYMENGRSLSQLHLSTQPINWHYLPMSDEEYRVAISEVGAED
jgi:transketolase